MLAELRQNLEAQIREGQLLEALDALLVKLPYGSETYRIVSALITRLNSAKRERARNTISFDEYLRLESQVSADLFDLLARLKEADFSPTSTQASTAESEKKGKYGTVLYRVPDVMMLQETTECLIRVAVEEAEIRKGLDIDEHVEIRAQVEISDVMRAEIVDPQGETFKIISHNAANQLVRATGITEWTFSVMPLRIGVHKLLVKVSIMEIVPGFPEPILRDVSVMETVTVVAQTSEAIGHGGGPIRSEAVDFKPNGQSFAFHSTSTVQAAYEINVPPADEPPYSPGPTHPPSTDPPSNQTTKRPLRALALFLAFLVIVPAATWAIAPDLPAYVVAVIQDTPEAYADFIENHPESPRLEKAYLYRAEVSGQLADLRAYQDRFQDSGKYRAQIMGKIAALETKSLDNIRERPDSLKIRKFVKDFPESERLAEVKQAVETRADKRQELLAQVEEAYVSSVKARPTETKVTAYLRDFPKQEKLDEVDAAVRTKPEVFTKVQAQLEDAYLKKMEANPTKVQSEQFIEKFPQPKQQDKFEKILDKKPGLKKEIQEKINAVKSEPKNPEIGQNRDSPGRNRKSGFDLITIDGGAFTMGKDDDKADDNCGHTVQINTFDIGKYEVTQLDWYEIMGTWPSKSPSMCYQCPVTNVSWNDVQDFLQKANQIHKKSYKLPSEEEWEFAARGGRKANRTVFSGSKLISEVGWYNDNSGKNSHPVGKLLGNELGIYDMSGNAGEWCANIYAAYPGCPEPKEVSTSRVIRGGSWNDSYSTCTVTRRSFFAPWIPDKSIGFRLSHNR